MIDPFAMFALLQLLALSRDALLVDFVMLGWVKVEPFCAVTPEQFVELAPAMGRFRYKVLVEDWRRNHG